MGKYRETTAAITKFFRNILGLTDYADNQEKIDKKLSTLEHNIEVLTGLTKETIEKVDKTEQGLNNIATKLDKTNSGVQKVLYETLTCLEEKYKKQHYATRLEKEYAKTFYDEIHNLGMDGFSERCIQRIMDMPESEEEYNRK